MKNKKSRKIKKSRKNKKLKSILIPPEPAQDQDEETFIMSDAQRGIYSVTKSDMNKYEGYPKERVNDFGKRKRSKKHVTFLI